LLFSGRVLRRQTNVSIIIVISDFMNLRIGSITLARLYDHLRSKSLEHPENWIGRGGPVVTGLGLAIDWWPWTIRSWWSAPCRARMCRTGWLVTS
jgi:hypothetical protein